MGQNQNVVLPSIRASRRYWQRQRPQISYAWSWANAQPDFRLLEAPPTELVQLAGSNFISVSGATHRLGIQGIDYQGRIENELERAKMRAEESLELERTTMLEISNGKEILGTMRLFNGSPTSRDHSFVLPPAQRTIDELHYVGEVERKIVSSPSEFNLPRLFPSGNMNATDFYWLHMLRENGVGIIEIGDFNLKGDLNNSDRFVVRDSLERAMLYQLYQFPPGTAVIGHVATPMHEALYRKEYGFKSVERLVIGKTRHTLMLTSVGELRALLIQRMVRLALQARLPKTDDPNPLYQPPL